jgi:NAD(P)-dependent dehydrogenase (short-subunit alcohol dehydrogenase family)
MNPTTFQNKIIVITGASDGFDAERAKQFAAFAPKPAGDYIANVLRSLCGRY